MNCIFSSCEMRWISKWWGGRGSEMWGSTYRRYSLREQLLPAYVPVEHGHTSLQIRPSVFHEYWLISVEKIFCDIMARIDGSDRSQVGGCVGVSGGDCHWSLLRVPTLTVARSVSICVAITAAECVRGSALQGQNRMTKRLKRLIVMASRHQWWLLL